ncbi:MAG TPA: SGNH/GDSL hydrolase family protein [Thermoanaerobaculia bacterium]|nr:SGNH/GDSL hydrolase family protein [Thermoanaerobaculia bacterium]
MARRFNDKETGLKKLSLALLVAVGALVISAVLTELLWRFLRARSWVPASPFVVAYDEDLGWRYRPGTRARHRTADFDVDVRFDAHGRRVMEEAPPPGAPLAVFVGDSLTFGWGVTGKATFAARIGKVLGFRTTNLGVAGYGTDQSYLKLRREGLPLRPKLVVYTFSSNDLVEVLHEKRYGRAKPRFRLEGARLVLSPVRDRSRFLERHFSLLGSWQSFLQGLSPAPLSEAEIQEARRLIVHLVRAMAEESRAAGATFVLVAARQPWLKKGLAGQPGVVLVDIGPALDRARREGPVGFSHDPHWNTRGHQTVAAEVVQALEASGFPAGSPGA